MTLYASMTSSIDPQIFDEVTLISLPGTKTLISSTQVDAVMHSQSETIRFKIPKTLRHAAVQMPRHDFCRLRPSQWLNDEVVNAYVALLDANTPDDILFVSSFFMSQLHSGGYCKVTRFLKGVSHQQYANGKPLKLLTGLWPTSTGTVDW